MAWRVFYFFEIFTEVMVNDPATALSLKRETCSFLSFSANI